MKLKAGKVSERIAAYNLTATSENQIEITGNQAKPVGAYKYYFRKGRTIEFSGFGSRDAAGNAICGWVGGSGKSIEEGKIAARGACLNFINNLLVACNGDLDGVEGISIRVDINCPYEFFALPKVADGASELLQAVFGMDVGTPLRTAAGCSSLPNNMTVEITARVVISKELAKELNKIERMNLSQDRLFKLTKSDETPADIVDQVQLTSRL